MRNYDIISEMVENREVIQEGDSAGALIGISIYFIFFTMGII